MYFVSIMSPLEVQQQKICNKSISTYYCSKPSQLPQLAQKATELNTVVQQKLKVKLPDYLSSR